MKGFCWNEHEHERKAEDDARCGRRDYEYYDQYSDDPCKQVYVETYDREIRDQHRREEARIEEEQAESRAERRRQLEREMDDIINEDFPVELWHETGRREE